LWRFVNQRTEQPRAGSFDVDKTTACPRNAPELDKELNENPERGMPFGFPPLTTTESETIASWLRRGAGGPASALDDDKVEKEIAKWEDFLNGHDSGSDSRTPLVAAYLFEHLFYAHLHFDSAPGVKKPPFESDTLGLNLGLTYDRREKSQSRSASRPA
jgi:hypothetical protein